MPDSPSHQGSGSTRTGIILRTLTNVEATIQAICKIREGDGVVFDGESVKGTRIKAEDEYEAAMHS